ncbi:NAD(P)H-hydrate dehydratase [Streptomyces sp. NPDC018347]|uniref:NAD(P)H-hydrate dehydratase n=1 Tax=Streptomyces sp. NPDC018347 TaxID=3157193 RepID=UPI0033D73979
MAIGGSLEYPGPPYVAAPAARRAGAHGVRIAAPPASAAQQVALEAHLIQGLGSELDAAAVAAARVSRRMAQRLTETGARGRGVWLVGPGLGGSPVAGKVLDALEGVRTTTGVLRWWSTARWAAASARGSAFGTWERTWSCSTGLRPTHVWCLLPDAGWEPRGPGLVKAADPAFSVVAPRSGVTRARVSEGVATPISRHVLRSRSSSHPGRRCSAASGSDPAGDVPRMLC